MAKFKIRMNMMLCSRARKVKSHLIWSGDEQEKSNVPECFREITKQ